MCSDVQNALTWRWLQTGLAPTALAHAAPAAPHPTAPAFLQCCIDLKDNVLRFGSTGAALPFLAEHELPKGQHGAERTL